MIELDFDPQPLLESVQHIGAQADFILDAADAVSFKVNQGALENHNLSRTRLLGVRLIYQGRVGLAFSESLEAQSLAFMLKQATENAKIAKHDEHQQLLAPDAWATGFQADQFFCRESQSHSQLFAKLQTLEQQILSAKSITSCPYNSISLGQYGRRLFSTQGQDIRAFESKASVYAYALAQEQGKTAMAGTGQMARVFSALQLEALANDVQNKTLEMLSGKPMATGRFDVIFTPENLASFMGLFAQAWSGKSALDGVSAWRDKLNQQVASPNLSLLDCPQNSGFGACHFDDEGRATQQTTIIEQGYLHTFIHNSATAKALGMVNTSHAQRSPKSALGVAHHQLNIAPGTIDAKALRAGEYLEITQLTGLHSGANAITGDFSFGASGFLCRDGIRQQAVRGITIAGNFFQSLHHLVLDTEQQWNWQKTMLMPGIRFQQFSIAGE